MTRSDWPPATPSSPQLTGPSVASWPAVQVHVRHSLREGTRCPERQPGCSFLTSKTLCNPPTTRPVTLHLPRTQATRHSPTSNHHQQHASSDSHCHPSARPHQRHPHPHPPPVNAPAPRAGNGRRQWRCWAPPPTPWETVCTPSRRTASTRPRRGGGASTPWRWACRSCLRDGRMRCCAVRVVAFR